MPPLSRQIEKVSHNEMGDIIVRAWLYYSTIAYRETRLRANAKSAQQADAASLGY